MSNLNPKTLSNEVKRDNGKTVEETLEGILDGTTKVPKANSGDMLRTFDRSSVWHDDRLLYAHEVADGKYELYVQEPTRVCKVGTDYTKSIQGSVITSLTHVAKILDGVSADAATAFLSVNVGSVYDGCVAIVTVYRQAGTPYAQIKGICSGLVVNGILPIEIYGYGFIPQHSMAVNILLAKLGG